MIAFKENCTHVVDAYLQLGHFVERRLALGLGELMRRLIDHGDVLRLDVLGNAERGEARASAHIVHLRRYALSASAW